MRTCAGSFASNPWDYSKETEVLAFGMCSAGGLMILRYKNGLNSCTPKKAFEGALIIPENSIDSDP